MTPAARIAVNGVEKSTLFTGKGGLLVSLTVTDEAGHMADAVEITIDDREGNASPKPGDEIRVWLGYEPQPLYMGRFKVERVRKSGPRRIATVSAKSAELSGPIRNPKTRSHHGKTFGEIARKVAGEHGLTPTIDPAFDALHIEHIDQQTESDLAFMQRLATRSGAVFKVADGSLYLTRKGAAQLPSGTVMPSTTLRPADCESWEWESGSRGDFKALVCRFRVGGETKTVRAGEGDAGSTYRDRRLYGSKAEAEAAAKAQLGDRVRGKVSASIEGSRGLPEVFAESNVTLADFDAEMNGSYRVKSVRHMLDGGGFRTSIELEIGGEA